MSDEQQPAAPRPGPHLFGPASVRPVPAPPGGAAPERGATGTPAFGSVKPDPSPAADVGPADPAGGSAESAGGSTEDAGPGEAAPTAVGGSPASPYGSTAADPEGSDAGTEGSADAGTEGPAGADRRPAASGGPERTGEPRVDEALAVLGELAGRPTGDQVAGYEQVHRSLQEVLATVDDA